MADSDDGCGCLIVLGLCGVLLYSCDMLEKIDKRTKNLEEVLINPITKNVLGQKEPEKFYELNGRRIYLEIDGKPVEEYFKK